MIKIWYFLICYNVFNGTNTTFNVNSTGSFSACKETHIVEIQVEGHWTHIVKQSSIIYCKKVLRKYTYSSDARVILKVYF